MQAPESIRSWDGATQLAAEVARRGFSIPDRFIELTAPLVGKTESAWRDGLRCYAREYVHHCGKQEQGNGVGAELAFVRKELVMNPALRDGFPAMEKQWKSTEVVSDALLQRNWSDQKSHLRRVAQTIAQAEGFHLTPKGYRLELPGALQLEVEIDVGRPGSTIQQIVMYNKLRANGGRWEMWLPWDELLPGIGFYVNGSDSATLIWGIKAFVAAGKVFASTLK